MASPAANKIIECFISGFRLFESNFLTSTLGIDVQQGVQGANAHGSSDDEYDAEPADGCLQCVKYIAHQQDAHDDPDDAVNFSNIVFE